MGWGDEIIATGQARLIQQEHGKARKVVVRDRHGAIRSHEMWRNNPRIATRSDRLYMPIDLVNGPGIRPYIAAKSDTRWTWNEWECPVGEVYFSADEAAFAPALDSSAVIIEPNFKSKASPNKDWGLERWKELARLMRAAGFRPTQLGEAGTRVLEGARLVDTPSFRHGCAVLSRARAAVLPEGGLHHAAAALGVRSVVIYGGYIGPLQTGYALHVNLFTGGKACGMRVPCDHCARAMAAITPSDVMAELGRLL